MCKVRRLAPKSISIDTISQAFLRDYYSQWGAPSFHSMAFEDISYAITPLGKPSDEAIPWSPFLRNTGLCCHHQEAFEATGGTHGRNRGGLPQEVWGGAWRTDSLASQIRRLRPSPLHHWTVGWQGRLQPGVEGALECGHCGLKMYCCLCYLQMMV